MSRAPRHTWSNWAGSVTADPVRVVHPGSTEGVADAVRAARAEGLRVKAVGSGHSFSAVAQAPDVQLRLDRLTGLVDAGPAARRVTLRAGTPLHDIPRLLAPLGLAMTNLGDIDRQTISGAVSTGTHGTGLAFGGLATQVVGLRLVDGTGEVRHLDEGDPELAGAALSLGALGILTEVTLRCTDAFVLRAVERPEPLPHVLASFVERCRAEDHLEFYWFPGTGTALTKTNTRLPAGTRLAPLTRRRRLVGAPSPTAPTASSSPRAGCASTRPSGPCRSRRSLRCSARSTPSCAGGDGGSASRWSSAPPRPTTAGSRRRTGARAGMSRPTASTRRTRAATSRKGKEKVRRPARVFPGRPREP